MSESGGLSQLEIDESLRSLVGEKQSGATTIETSLTCGNQPAQNAQIDLVQIDAIFFTFRCLQIHRRFAEPPIVHEKTERFDSYLASADACVAIDARAELDFAIVEMKGSYLLEAHRLVERPHRRLVFLFSPHRVARSEDMTGIETDSDPVGVLGRIENRRQLLELPTEIASLTGGCFQQHFCLQFFRLPTDFIQPFVPAASLLVVNAPGWTTT